MKEDGEYKNKVYTIEHGMLGSGLYAGVVILDTSEIEDVVDYGGMLYKLKEIGIKDGEEYQSDSAGDLLMNYDAYQKCKKILKRFGVKAVNI